MAGIKVKMITGDHELTALAIARKIGIADENTDAKNAVLNGKIISALSDEQLIYSVKTTSVFARVAPEDKLRLVKALHENGDTIAMTGDGVYLGGDSIAHIKIMQLGSTPSNYVDPRVTNESGFTALPGGEYSWSDFWNKGSFEYLGQSGHWWSSTVELELNGWFRILDVHFKRNLPIPFV